MFTNLILLNLTHFPFKVFKVKLQSSNFGIKFGEKKQTCWQTDANNCIVAQTTDLIIICIHVPMYYVQIH